ncbi:HlyD family type I secretion periplasmic adaptor subunit [Pseudooceanicola sp. MF1-13]|uniref:HlyD family type I secretion periplasmic adaptor subunit n=1 Tax=Pseudooceanicola sp. MF1-13 TaxID=3379095 RepID=UPI0038914B42
MSGPDFKAISRELNGKPPISASLLLVVIMILLGTLLAWASVTEIDDVTRAQARVVPSEELQVVQAAETGQVVEILVTEGETVTAGDPLLRLDPTLLRAQFDEAREQAQALRIRITRLEAELEGETPEYDADLAEAAPRMVAVERAVHLGNVARLNDELALIESQRRILSKERDRADREAELAQTSRGLVGEEVALIAPLVERKIEPETTLIALRREAARLDGQLAIALADKGRIDSQEADLVEQEAALRSRFRADALEQLSQAVTELSALEQRLPALEARAGRAELKAPVGGVVNQVLVATLGGVVQQGQTLVEIVPVGSTKRVEAYVAPQDIAFLRPDQPVKVRLTAYDASRYGALDGHITRIGADAVTAPDGESRVFVVAIEYEGELTDADGEPLDVIPGMVAEVDILSEKKTVLSYLTRPVVRVKDRAFRD